MDTNQSDKVMTFLGTYPAVFADSDASVEAVDVKYKIRTDDKEKIEYKRFENNQAAAEWVTKTFWRNTIKL